MIKQLGTSNAYKNVCAASAGRGQLFVNVSGMPMTVRCEHAAEACNCAEMPPDAFACPGVPYMI